VLVDDSEVDQLADLHTKTDLGEGRMCSSRSVTWSLLSQTQSPLQEGCNRL